MKKREPWEVESDRMQLDVIFGIYRLYITSACVAEGKALEDLDYHFKRMELLLSQCKGNLK